MFLYSYKSNWIVCAYCISFYLNKSQDSELNLNSSRVELKTEYLSININIIICCE